MKSSHDPYFFQNIYIGSDHAGYRMKQAIIHELQEVPIQDMGTDSEEPVDYPDIVHRIATRLREEPLSGAILICGSGNGVCMTANRYPFIRAALAWNETIAQLARAHNNANVLCLPGRFLSEQEAIPIVKTFLKAPFEGGRHERRLAKMNPS